MPARAARSRHQANRTRRNPVGGHVLVRGGLGRGAIRHADEIGAEAVQVFVSNPRGWAQPPGDPEQDSVFRAHCENNAIPVFVHAPYLINFGSPTPQTLSRSVESTRHALRRGAELGARGVVVHAGSAVGGARHEDAMRQVGDHLRPLLDEIADSGPLLLVEPTAGGGAALAARAEDLPGYLDALGWHPRVGVCLDTCHLYAAGHDISTATGMRSVLTAVSRAVGARRVGLVHANDTVDPCGSTRDHHAAIGSGNIGLDAFGALFEHPVTRGVPVVAETPEAGLGQDVSRLKQARDGD